MQVVDPDRGTSSGPFEPERWAISTHRVNVLVQGTRAFISDTLAVLRRDLDHPEFVWPDLPVGRSTSSATLLVQEIGELSADALDALVHLIADTHPRVQVVVTSSVVLYELVARGEFPADLYYRLNIVTLTGDRDTLSAKSPAS